MVEQFSSINTNGLSGLNQGLSQSSKAGKTTGEEFKNLLMESISEVNRMQDDAEKATTELVTGKTDNVAEVFTAVQKADLAFQTLLQIRNKLMDAYDEIKNMRV